MERRLSAILAADMVGFSRLIEADELGTIERQKAHRTEFINPAFAEHRGRIVKTTGDGLLAEFSSVVDAVQCAVAIQLAMIEREAEVSEESRIRYRIGINLGDVIVDDDDGDLYGDGVNVAARLEQLAEPGGIFISGTTFDHLKSQVEVGYEPLGEVQVKNIERPIRVYKVLLHGKQPVPLRPKAPSSIMRARWSVAAAVAALVLTGGAWWWSKWPDFEPADPAKYAFALPDKPSIAVLPFENLSASTDDRLLADGLTSDLITDLSKISGLLVIARNTSFSYKDRKVDIREIAHELGVRYVLEGSVRPLGENIRVNAQLIDSQSGENLWADRLDRSTSDMFAVQDEIIEHIVDRLAIKLSTSERQRVKRLPTRNLEAYDYYLRAEEAARSGFRPRLREALQLYAKATSLDPSFAGAFAAQARSEALVMRRNYDDILAFPVARKLAYEHAGRALELDPEAALPFAVLSELQTVDNRYEEALLSARRAVDMAPGEAATHLALSFVHTFGGRHPEAIAEFETALRLNPRLPASARQIASLSYILNGQAERAVEVLEAVRIDSTGVGDYFVILGAAYAELGKTEEARLATREAVRIGPNGAVELYRVNFGHFRKNDDLERILDAMTRAGLQKWPFDFQPGSLQPLDNEEIERLAIGRVWRGKVEGIGPGILQILPDNTMAIRTGTLFATGTARVSGDQLCLKYESLALGRPVCGPVFEPSRTPTEEPMTYTYVNAHLVFHFTPDG